jgi:hypothetical protein
MLPYELQDWVFRGIALNMWIVLRSIVIFTILILLAYEHLLMSSSVSLRFSSFHCRGLSSPELNLFLGILIF